MSLEWNLHTNQQPVSESVTMNEAHVVLLDKSELPAVLKHITVFKACLQTEKELSLYSPELRAETETKHPVLVADKAVLVQSGNGFGISYNQNHFYFRIDHILLSKNLESYQCTVDKTIKSSDHYPIWCFVAKK